MSWFAAPVFALIFRMSKVSKRSKISRRSHTKLQSSAPLDFSRAAKALPLSAPVAWLTEGLSDVRSSQYRSLFYGVCFVLMGYGINHAHAGNRTVALAVAAGFLFAGPFLATGLYELSRQIQAGERRELVLSLFAWCRNPGPFGQFAAFLSIVMVIWLWLSVPLFDSLAQGFTVRSALLFLVWFLLALMVFTASVISIPMMLDTSISAWQAIKNSVSSCLFNWQAHGFWALLIVSIIGGSLMLGYWPLLITGPVVGHATWHAYQANRTQCL